MAKAANYVVIADNWVQQMTSQHKINFEIPANIDLGQRAVIGFIIDADSLEGGMKVVVRLNNNNVWNWSYPSGQRREQFFQEVVGTGVLKAGINEWETTVTKDDGVTTQTRFSDIVLWFKVDI